MSGNNWFINVKTNPHAKYRLVCFPYAGGGPSSYIPWASSIPADYELLILQMPGRAARFGETPIDDIHELFPLLVENFKPFTDLPYVFFGHSLGSRIAFGLMKSMERLGFPLPVHFIASGSRAPHIEADRDSVLHMNDVQFKEYLRDLGGTPPEILENQEFLDLLMPILKADFRLSETCVFSPNCAYDCPISVFTGVEDTDISEEQLAGWQQFFQHKMALTRFSGGHFFIDEHRSSVVAEVNQVLNLLSQQLNPIRISA